MSGAVQIDRYVARERRALLARGRCAPLFADFLEHSRRWVGDPDGLVAEMMRQGLAAAALYLTCRPRDEETAWTINLPEPPLNLFFVADASRGRVVGRYFDRHVRAQASSRLFVQSVRGFAEPHQSVIEVRGFDVLSMLESYHAQSEQSSARFLAYEDDEYLMVMALPGIDEAWLRGLSRGEARALLEDASTTLIEVRPVTFGCACDERRIMGLATSLFAGQEEELFGDDERAEILCPRCGHAYEIHRRAFDAALKASGAGGPATAPPDSAGDS